MISEINLIKFIIGRMINSKEERIKGLLSLQRINWRIFKELIVYHDLIPFAYLTLKNSNSFLPQDLREFLKNNYYCTLTRCQNLWQEFLRMSIAFEQAGITLVPIKGIALLQDIYTNLPFRPMTDIDLIVKEEDLKKAEVVFYDLGYRKELYGLKEEYWRRNQYHITFYKKEEQKVPFVELHWSLDFKRKNRLILPELWERIRKLDVDGTRINLLSPEDTLFSLALHNRRFGRTLCLKNTYDFILLLNKYASDIDWNYVLNQSRKYNLCSTLFFALCQVKLLSDLNVPEFVWKELNLPNWKMRLIQRFIEQNTFLWDKKVQNKNLYLKSHFLLYDNIWEPIDYIVNIPKEQFAKFYEFEPYDKKTDFLYWNRMFYIPFKVMYSLILKTN